MEIIGIIFAIAIIVSIANVFGKAKSYSSARDNFAQAWLSTFGTPAPDQALSAVTRMMSFITEKEVDHSFGGTAANDYAPLSDSLDDFRSAVNYDDEKTVMPILFILQTLDNTPGYPRAKQYVPAEFMLYMRRRGLD